ncbi:MAG: shikimate kinase [Flavobacteriaceae bacterium]|nr:shikimate kinase [Flavobacteriaceae bacterium]
MKIVLLGYMGSGKSTVAKSLADKIPSGAIDLDDFISAKEKMSIPELFSQKGEIYFRKIESQYLKELLLEKEDLVIALGGGTPCYGNNIQEILIGSTSVYLKASIETLAERLEKERPGRPLIANLPENGLEEFIAKHLFERKNYYEQANHIVSIDGKTIEKIVEEISSLIQISDRF